jgi:D-aminoacyl-tRNA deacylase
MRLILTSKEDEASMNILDKLLKKKDWETLGNFEGNPCYVHGDLVIVTINTYHLYYDNIDLVVKKKLALSPEVIIVASKHRSESGMSTLSVHPIGNYSKAEFGGKERQLVPSCPGMMTNALRILSRKAKDANLDYQVSFEVTHHGPYLGTPTFFIEIGSLEPQWRDEKAAEVIAETILETENADYPVALGIGGGHYAPRLTDVVRAHDSDVRARARRRGDNAESHRQDAKSEHGLFPQESYEEVRIFEVEGIVRVEGTQNRP